MAVGFYKKHCVEQEDQEPDAPLLGEERQQFEADMLALGGSHVKSARGAEDQCRIWKSMAAVIVARHYASV